MFYQLLIVQHSMSVKHGFFSSKSVSGGSFGDVSFGTYRGKNVVRKDFRYMTTINDRKYNYRETYTLATCNHENIVAFIGAGPDTQIADVRYIVIERASNASLAERKLPFPSLG